MKRKLQIISVCLCLLLMLCAAQHALAAAAPTVKITFDKSSVKVGQTLKMNYSIKGKGNYSRVEINWYMLFNDGWAQTFGPTITVNLSKLSGSSSFKIPGGARIVVLLDVIEKTGSNKEVTHSFKSSTISVTNYTPNKPSVSITPNKKYISKGELVSLTYKITGSQNKKYEHVQWECISIDDANPNNNQILAKSKGNATENAFVAVTPKSGNRIVMTFFITEAGSEREYWIDEMDTGVRIIQDTTYTFSPANNTVHFGIPSENNQSIGFNELTITANKKLLPLSSSNYCAKVNFNVGTLGIYRYSDDKPIWKAENNPFAPGTSSNLILNSAQTKLTIEPTNRYSLLEPDTKYYVLAPKGFFYMEDGSVSPPIKKGEWTFTTRTLTPATNKETDIPFSNLFGEKTSTVSMKWDDSWFANSNTTYNHKLAQSAIALSGAAYQGKSKITDVLKKLDFPENSIECTYETPTATNNDIVSYAIASKKIWVKDHDETLVAIIIKGTSANSEWYSNFNMGSSGDDHRGFRLASDKVISTLNSYLSDHHIDAKKARFFITGHSRGAGVGNLVAATLTGEDYKYNVYAYTFASPNTSVKAKTAKYQNIFNIVSNEDFVTRIPLEDWDFKRYGVTLILPSKSYSGSAPSGYAGSFSLMTSTFQVMTKEKYNGYNGTKEVDRVIDKVYSLAETRKEYFTNEYSGPNPVDWIYKWTLEDYFTLIASIKANDTASAMLPITYRILSFISLNNFFIANTKIDPEINCTHSAAAYYSWMKNCTPKELFGISDGQSFVSNSQYAFKRATVACPVDVYAYNQKGELVAAVENEAVTRDILAVHVEDGVKTIDFPNDQPYSIKIIATGEGTVSYSVEEIRIDGSRYEPVNTMVFDPIPIKDGDVLTGKIPKKFSPKQEYKLVDEDPSKDVSLPETGDHSNLPLWFALSAFSILACMAVNRRSKA